MDDIFSMFDEEMFDPEDLFDSDEVYRLPMEMVIHLRNRTEPLFAEHVFFFEKEDPIASVKELMNFTATWWNAINEDRNVRFIFLTDRNENKKAIAVDDIVSVSFVAPEEPEWMKNEQDDTDSD